MSKIEWTEETWNPVTGCTKISEGCQNCYAEKMHKRLQAMGQGKYKYPFNEIKHHFLSLIDVFGKKPKMIFVNSMSDLFHDSVFPPKTHFIFEVFKKIENNPQHTFQILTKRSHNLVELTNEYKTFKFPSNVWLGVSVELAKYKNRIDDLRQTNAKVKFLSCEPLLGDLGELDLTGIHWVIVGGESGPGARPMHPQWVRNIKIQCQEQGVPFFFKQWGEYKGTNVYNYVSRAMTLYGKEFWMNFEGKILDTFESYDNQYPGLVARMEKVGKKKAGCLLDGIEYKEMPI